MFKIGDFSKLSQVSVKTLRYYDELGLLKPVEVDRFTGYRYYSADQLPRLNGIRALQDLGLTLEQIADLLDQGLPAAQLRGMLRLKQAELKEQVREEQARLARVETRLKQIEQEGMVPTQAYNAFLSWVQTNGYRIVGPNREIYLKTAAVAEQVHQDDASYVIEIQLPVQKI